LAQDTPRSSSIGRLEIVNLVVVVLIVAGVAGLNRVVDPFQRHADFDLGLHHREVTWRMSYPHFNLATWLRAPSEGVLLGDSRMLQIQPEALEEATGLSWTNMAAGGSSGRDIVENLRFVLTHTAPQHAVIGWNLNLLNGAHQTDHVASAREIIESPLRYHLNPFITKASAFLLYEKWTGENPISETPPMSPEQFWEHQLKVTAAFAYRDFQMPDALLADLSSAVEEARAKGTRVTFLFFPTHADLHQVARDMGVADEYAELKRQITALGPVVDWDRTSPLTTDRAHFSDPWHFKPEVAPQLLRGLVRSVKASDRSGSTSPRP
jgi:hypothetical protein